MAPAASKEEAREASWAWRIEVALGMLEPLHARVLALLETGGCRSVPGYLQRRSFAFIEKEVRAIISSLSRSPWRDNDMDYNVYTWLVDVVAWARATSIIIEEAESRRHMLLPRISPCLHPSNLSRFFRSPTCHNIAQDHRLLLATPPDIVVPPAGATVRLVGFDGRINKLLRWLTPTNDGEEAGNNGLRALSIVGPAGVGKTTLAMELHRQLQYNSGGGGRCCFELHAKAHISRGPDRNKLLLRDILSQISDPPQTSSLLSVTSKLEELVRCVSICLQNKRYFILIDGVDDVWGESDLTMIKDAFPDNNCGSRILITTRMGSIGWLCYSYFDGLVHDMKPLNQKYSEKLLLAKTFDSMDGCQLHNVVLACDKIFTACEGVPLLITGMVDWLKQQLLQELKLQHKYNMQRHQIFVSCRKEQVPQLPKRFEQALAHAYYDLPRELRHLSLYMSLFPQGYLFKMDCLITKWLQEGFILGSMEHAEICFFQLVDRNVINPVLANYECDPDKVDACYWQVNHYMLQFLASKSAEVGFAFTSGTLNSVAPTTASGNPTPRRLALHHPDPNLPYLLEKMDFSQTRSLAVSGAVNAIQFDKFINLMVLDLEGWENLKENDLLQICRSKMLFLRYLSVRNTQIRKLPSEVKQLFSLEILDVSHTKISELPLEVFKLRFLSKLDLRSTRIRQLPKQIVKLKDSLNALLVGGEEPTDSVETTRMPQDIWHLDNLETLATVDLSQHPASFLDALDGLQSLRVIAILWSFQLCTDRAYTKALLSSIRKWKELRSLTIRCGFACSMEFLGSLSDPPQKLEKLKVTVGRFISVPKWISGLNCLFFVQITICRLEVDDLKILGDLSSLQCLILGLDFIPRKVIVIQNGSFSKLLRLSIDCPVPWLTFSTEAMPNLTYLQLKFCSGPGSQGSRPCGISNLHRLTEVVLSYSKWCADSTSIKRTIEAVKEEVAKHRNPIDLIIDGTIVDVQEVDQETERATEIS
ncbi:hypothetical protein SEVIR_8G193900v4 [Setaria viridis]|uniref:Uncharacterized protein n=1 Tax=Setaria viridis TaxID=4556 RepID=A0A4U6TV93_SETVI|nr:disease resistance protein Pikm1-TS-like [Setaria viridis]TKW01637.1 hypothetical protein SEVIR_8G193900v2 [Setaria viridis]